jgi:23S rRNA pseudouridine2457 synthase
MNIEDIHLENLQAGEVREIEEDDFFSNLKIDNWK